MGARYVPDDSEAQARCIVIRPNRSLSLRGLIWLLIAYAALLSIIGLGFLQAGAWIVLPFAGSEAIVICAVFYFLVYRHANDHEVVLIDGDTITIIKHNGTRESRDEFQNYWTRVSLQRAQNDQYPSRLMLGSCGRQVEVAAEIREEDRRALAQKLKTLLGQTAYS
ncbi:MAG: DUF2244 domain-containing protein [Acidiferrobacterales bacterium]